MNYFLQPQSYFQIPALIPTRIPPCNYAECLQYLIQKYPDVPPSDIFKSLMRILFMSKIDAPKVLDKTLTNAQSTETSCSDSYYIFHLTDAPYPQYNKGDWITTDNRFAGQDLSSLVRTVRGGSDLDAIEFIAGVIGVDFTKTNVPQIEKWEGHSFIRYPHAYPNGGLSSMVMNMLGAPNGRYCFYSTNGHPSFFLLEWEAAGEPLRLFLTLQQDDHHVGNRWEFIAPPVDDKIYNNHLIKAYEDLEVHIHDDIRNADDSNTPQTVGTWAGDPSFAFKLTWAFLKGRVVKYLFNPQNKDSFKIGAYLLQIFQDMGIELGFCEYYK